MENPDCGSLSVWKTTAAFPKEVSGKCRWHSCKRLPGNAGDTPVRDYREMSVTFLKEITGKWQGKRGRYREI